MLPNWNYATIIKKNATIIIKKNTKKIILNLKKRVKASNNFQIHIITLTPLTHMYTLHPQPTQTQDGFLENNSILIAVKMPTNYIHIHNLALHGKLAKLMSFK
jgi:hypothetical protein